MILKLCILSDPHDEGLALLEGVEFELARQGVDVSVPSLGATTSDNILNDVLVHLLELGLALFVEGLILFLQLVVGVL